MNKNLLKNLFFTIIIALFITCFALILNICCLYWDSYYSSNEILQSMTPEDSVQYIGALDVVNQTHSHAIQATIASIFCGIGVICLIFIFVFLNKAHIDVKVQDIIEKRKTKELARIKHEKARKAARISELEKELNELKKGGE